jgi:hypothetical protein
VGDYVVDAIHTRAPSVAQQELPFHECVQGYTQSQTFINVSGPYTIAIQGCRKVEFGHDMCTQWSDYTYTPPAQPQAPANNPAPNKAAPQAPVSPPPYQQLATTIGQTDVFDIAHDGTPDPATGVVGGKIGTLKDGQGVYLGQPCNNGWCQVNSGSISRGYGFVEQSHLRFS